MHITLEDHIKEKCPSCKKTHSKEWDDQFSKHDHYLTLTCDCGYKIFIKSNVMTSGTK